jgi:asparagine synthase (glutamine-hydrolysing)
MCGICGCVETIGHDAAGIASTKAKSRVESMLRQLAHRGPDGSATFSTNFASLGHARLSIIDLAGGAQPLFNEDRTLALVANGEIYNHQEIRQKLLSRGHHFRTGSDCEVIVHLYEEVGTACLDEIQGMFAFAILDTRQKTLFAARDRFGQKPFYYSWQAERFSFASEASALLPVGEALSHEPAAIDPVALDQYLYYQFVPAPRTLFEKVQALPAGHALELKLSERETETHSAELVSSELRTWAWWSPPVPRRCSATSSTADFWLNDLETVIDEAVRSHLLADVPVGLYLSGGIDSSLLGALACKHIQGRMPAFCISFPGSPMDEQAAAVCAARHLECDLEVVEFHDEDFVELVETSGRLLDLPLGDAALLPLLKLSRVASQTVKTVLTGDGGDELFGGYRKYRESAQAPLWWQKLHNFWGAALPVEQLLSVDGSSSGLRHLVLWSARNIFSSRRADLRKRGFDPRQRASLYRSNVKALLGETFELPERSRHEGLTWLDRALLDDQGTNLADRLLFKGDRATMGYGVEARAPFLDHHVAEFAATLPANWMIRGKETKYALRALARRHLPVEITERRKKGFSLPIKTWFATSLADWLHEKLLAPHSLWDELFEPSAIEQLLREHRSGRDNHADRLYSLLVLKNWMCQKATCPANGQHSPSFMPVEKQAA